MAAAKGWDLSEFQAEDIYRMAVTVEQGGFDFYNRIIDASDNQRVKNELRFLRDEEAKHKAFFQKQLAAKGATAEKEIAPALQRLLEAEFLQPMGELYAGSKIASNAEALRFGVELERKTVDFYTALKEKQQDPAFGRDLDVIIDEERKHQQKLNLILAY